jgi:hypothetical protein
MPLYWPQMLLKGSTANAAADSTRGPLKASPSSQTSRCYRWPRYYCQPCQGAPASPGCCAVPSARVAARLISALVRMSFRLAAAVSFTARRFSWSARCQAHARRRLELAPNPHGSMHAQSDPHKVGHHMAPHWALIPVKRRQWLGHPEPHGTAPQVLRNWSLLPSSNPKACQPQSPPPPRELHEVWHPQAAVKDGLKKPHCPSHTHPTQNPAPRKRHARPSPAVLTQQQCRQ